jgi:hypothetical protein
MKYYEIYINIHFNLIKSQILIDNQFKYQFKVAIFTNYCKLTKNIYNRSTNPIFINNRIILFYFCLSKLPNNQI